MRICAGRHRGRVLAAPPGLAVRPTAGRARQALLDSLAVGRPPLAGSRVLDLFAGTGALGLEAVSRGAAAVLCVELAGPALAVLRQNVALLGEGSRVQVLAADAARLPRAMTTFDIVFLDPPYGGGLAEPTLMGLVSGGWLSPGARVVVELERGERLAVVPPLLTLAEERRYGRTAFWLLRQGPGRFDPANPAADNRG